MFRHAFREFDEDPFFSGFGRHRDEFESIFPSSLGLMDRPAIRGAEDDRRGRRDRGVERQYGNHELGELAPRGLFGDVFSHMNNMMENMNSGFADIERRMVDLDNDPNAYSYSQSMVSSYRNDGSGEPKYYQAASSTSRAPGGVKHTRKAVRDSERGEQRMAVGRHIGERGHTLERHENFRTNERQEHQNFLGMDENDHESFNKEWSEKAGGLMGIGGPSNSHGGRTQRNGADRHKSITAEDAGRPQAAHGGKRPPRNALEYKSNKDEPRENTRKPSKTGERKTSRR